MVSLIDLLRTELISYLFRITLCYEDDVTELDNHTVYRKADPVDHLEMIMAKTRLATVEQITDDIYAILHLSYEREFSQLSNGKGED